jgi:hypothetical protein
MSDDFRDALMQWLETESAALRSQAESEGTVLKPEPEKLTVECPKCHQQVAETRCAFENFEYYKNCYCWITRPALPEVSGSQKAEW